MEHVKKMYSTKDLEIMRTADKARLMGNNRVNELITFAEISGIKKIGIAYCVSMQKEAMQLKDRLESKFEVVTADCKISKIKSSELLNDDSFHGISCNPAGQADLLSKNNTELNIAFGLCMGHDIIFNSKSTVQTTTLIVKDRQHKHNTYKEFQDL